MEAEQSATAATKAVDIMDKVATDLLGYLKDAVEFGKGQAPEVVEQFIKREIWEWGMWGVVWVLVLLLGLRMRSWATKYLKEGDDDEPVVFAMIFGWAAILCGIGGTIKSVTSMVSSWIAPKVLVLEKLGELLK